jgi:cytoskeleton protein RodZ
MVLSGTSDGSADHQRKGRFIDAATFGAYLQNRREGRHLSLHDVAAETKIAGRYLAALERGDVRSWPGGLYRRAMVRAYAAAIGLDPETTVCEFEDAFNEQPTQVEPDPSPAPLAVHGLLGIRARAFVGLGLAVCAAVLALVWAAKLSNAADTTGTIRTRPVATVGHHADAAPPITTSGVVSLSDAANIETHQRIATVTPLQTAPSHEPPAGVEGSMRIMSEPAGAHVTINGIWWGQTPVTVRYLPPGEKRVRLSKDGYVSVERRLQFTPENPTQAVQVILPVEP